MRAGHFLAAVALVAMTVPTMAEARGRNARSGFNFGTTVRLVGTTERTNAGEGSDVNTKSKGDTSLINPYLGYSFGSFNLGLTYSAESRSSESIEASEDGTSETTRTSDARGKGLSIFSRFLFGQVFFFEGGIGVYQERTVVTTETKHMQSEGVFIGEESSYEVKGTGPGYHLGAGLELPMGDGFHFTASYQARMVQLRDYDGGSDLGRKRSQGQKREVLFGLAYYDR